MKKRKDPTTTVACRISPELKEKFELAADELELSLAQYVSLMLNMAEFGDVGADEFRNQIADITNKYEALRKELAMEKDLDWKKAPFAAMLDNILKNEQILARYYGINASEPVESNKLLQEGFKYNALLQGENRENGSFYITGLYGWTFTDKSQKYIMIIKKG